MFKYDYQVWYYYVETRKRCVIILVKKIKHAHDFFAKFNKEFKKF